MLHLRSLTLAVTLLIALPAHAATWTIYPSGAPNAAASATGTITCSAKGDLADGQRVVLTSQNGGALNFIFKVTAGFNPALGPRDILVNVSDASISTAADVAAALEAATNNDAKLSGFGGIGYGVVNAGGGVLSLTQTAVGAAGNRAILVPPSFSTTGFAGGVDGPMAPDLRRTIDLAALQDAIDAASDGDVVHMKSYRLADEGLAPAARPVTPWVLGGPFEDFVFVNRDVAGNALFTGTVAHTAAGMWWAGTRFGGQFSTGKLRGAVHVRKAITIRGDVAASGEPATVVREEAEFDFAGWQAHPSRLSRFLLRYLHADTSWFFFEKRATLENLHFRNYGGRFEIYHPTNLTNVKVTNGSGFQLHCFFDARSVYPNYATPGPHQFDDPVLSTVKDCVFDGCVASVECAGCSGLQLRNCTLIQGKTEGHRNVQLNAAPAAGAPQQPGRILKELCDVAIEGCTLMALSAFIADNVGIFANGVGAHASKVRVTGSYLSGGWDGIFIVAAGTMDGFEISGDTIENPAGSALNVVTLPGGVTDGWLVAENALRDFLPESIPIALQGASSFFLAGNDTRDSGKIGIAAGGDTGATHFLLGCTVCTVFENGRFPQGQGGARNHVIVDGGAGNRVVGLPADEVPKPAGIGVLRGALRKAEDEVAAGDP